MKSLREYLHSYISMRRSLGFKLRRPSNALHDFIDFAEQRRTEFITVTLAMEWAQIPGAQPATWAGRLRNVRGFARYMSAFDPRTEVPPNELLPHRPKRARPYIYTDAEIQLLMEESLNLPICSNWIEFSLFKRQTYYYLIGLLSVTGMRISEATNLKVKNVDLKLGLIEIVGSKFGKSRIIPLHGTTIKALSKYKTLRDRFKKSSNDDCFFINMRGNQLDHGTVRKTFYILSRKAGMRTGASNRGPRIHDFRHRFAVHTLLQWYESGKDAERMLPILSTYLGHLHVNDTYWYLTAFPELMGSSVKRLELRWEKQT